MGEKPTSEDESEITPEMIEAGIGVLLRYHREHSDEADTVREIFSQMLYDRPRSP